MLSYVWPKFVELVFAWVNSRRTIFLLTGNIKNGAYAEKNTKKGTRVIDSLFWAEKDLRAFLAGLGFHT